MDSGSLTLYGWCIPPGFGAEWTALRAFGAHLVRRRALRFITIASGIQLRQCICGTVNVSQCAVAILQIGVRALQHEIFATLLRLGTTQSLVIYQLISPCSDDELLGGYRLNPTAPE